MVVSVNALTPLLKKKKRVGLSCVCVLMCLFIGLPFVCGGGRELLGS